MAMAWRGVEGEARAYGLAAMPLVLPLLSSRRNGTEGFAGGAMGVETSCSRRWCTSTTEPSQGERTETSGEDVEEVSVVEEDFDRKGELDLLSAIEIVQKEANANFLETVEMHVKLATDPKRSDQIVRGNTMLPHGTGKQSKIAVFASAVEREAAVSAGADIIGGEELVDSIKQHKGANVDFDCAIATPGMMPKLASIARILGPKGLMPNPKTGTVTGDVGQAVLQFRKGRVDFRADKGAVIHAGLGKVNFKNAALLENIATFFAAIMAARPKGVKGSGVSGYIKTVNLCSTMGKSVKVSIQSILNASTKGSKSGVKATM